GPQRPDPPGGDLQAGPAPEQDGEEAAVLVHAQAAEGGEPDAVAGDHEDIVDPDAGQAGRVVGVEGDEPGAVEAGKPGLGADPQVAQAVLGDGQGADLRQPFLDAPAVADVVVEGLVGIQRHRGAAGKQQRQQRQD